MRQPQPWFRTSKNAWYVEHRGHQHMLGKHQGSTPPKRGKTGWNPPSEIREAYRKLMADDPASIPQPNAVLVAQICDLFLLFSAKHNDTRTFKWYKAYLQDFCNLYGSLKSAELKPLHVTRWLDAHPKWRTGRRCAITAVKRAFSYAVEQGVIPASPIKSVKKPAVPSRARVMTREQRAEILATIPDQEFRLFVEAMQESGCRPSEVARVTAEDVNMELGVWVLHRHKTAGKTGNPRIVYLTSRLLEITKLLIAVHKTGILFRGPRLGKPFGMQGICSRFRRLRTKLPHLKDAIAYAYRHSFVTDALTRGVGVAQVAELMGHKSTNMILRHYGHLADQVAHMREAARQATGA